MIYTTLKAGAHHPYIIAIGSAIPQGSILKKIIQDTPLAIYRDQESIVHVFLDVCPHKKGILGVNNNTITCHYHGWEFDTSGKLIHIPSLYREDRLPKCHLYIVRSEEKCGFVWIYPDPTSIETIPDFIANDLSGWDHTYLQESFDTTEELLIENFMDATHTPVVHSGIIRSNHLKKHQHDITVRATTEGIEAHFASSKESIGLGISKLLNRHISIEHTDRYIVPNIVQVVYKLNGITRFEAIIGCTAQSVDRTYGFLKMSYQFGFIPNLIIKLLLPLISKIVLRQDKTITKSQYQNIQYFPHIPEHPLAYDMLHSRVRAYKASLRNREAIESQKDIQISIKL